MDSTADANRDAREDTTRDELEISGGTRETVDAGGADGGGRGDSGDRSPGIGDSDGDGGGRIKRGRGRPRKYVAGDDLVGRSARIGDTDHGSGGDDGGNHGSAGGAKPRKSKPGKRDKKAASIQARIESTAQLLYMSHGGLGMMTGAPEIGLSEQEARALAKAIVECADAWGFEPLTDPRIITAFALVGTAGAIYVPRAMTVVARKRASRVASAPQEVPGPAVGIQH